MKEYNKKRVVLFSGGLSSFETTLRVISNNNNSDTRIWFFDTKIEDDDTYRFIRDCEDYFKIKIEIFADGRNPWEVFRDERFIGNSSKSVCNRVLKRQLLEKLIKKEYPDKNVVLYFGINYYEKKRKEIILNKWDIRGIETRFPLFIKPHFNNSEIINKIKSLGIEIPRLYKLGFKHNNCGGACVKAGFSEWEKLYKFFPERYFWHEMQEEIIRKYLKKNVSILRSRKMGKTTPITLKEFRLNII